MRLTEDELVALAAIAADLGDHDGLMALGREAAEAHMAAHPDLAERVRFAAECVEFGCHDDGFHPLAHDPHDYRDDR